MPPGARYLLVRHGRTDYNDRQVLNGDPCVPVMLDDVGVAQCEAVGAALAGEEFDLAVHTRFPRTAQSLEVILAGRMVPVETFPEFDDVRMGVFEGRSVEDYRAWRRATGPDDPPPGEGESRLDALSRYAAGYSRLLDGDAERVIAVLHDVPIRMMANAAVGEDPLTGPVTRVGNAQVFRFGDAELRAGVARMYDRLGF